MAGKLTKAQWIAIAHGFEELHMERAAYHSARELSMVRFTEDTVRRVRPQVTATDVGFFCASPRFTDFYNELMERANDAR